MIHSCVNQYISADTAINSGHFKGKIHFRSCCANVVDTKSCSFVKVSSHTGGKKKGNLTSNRDVSILRQRLGLKVHASKEMALHMPTARAMSVTLAQIYLYQKKPSSRAKEYLSL